MSQSERFWYEIDPCPPWCVGEHDPHAERADQAHDSAGELVPMWARYADSEPVSADLSIVISRRAGEEHAWLIIGAEQCGCLVIEANYARPLLAALTRAVRAFEQAEVS